MKSLRIDFTTDLSFQRIIFSTKNIVSQKSIGRCGITLRLDKFIGRMLSSASIRKSLKCSK